MALLVNGNVAGGAGRTVGVVGTWGIVGHWVVRRLLQKGYFVRCGLRSSPDEAAELMALPCAEDRLELVQADALDYVSLALAFEGCTAVFLTNPSWDYLNGFPEYPVDIVNHEVMKALNVVEACANSASVRRLLLTSSASAVVFDAKNPGSSNPQVVDERCWSNVEFLRKYKLWSALSKTTTEKAAWALARDRGLDMVVINPAIIVGPHCSKSNSGSPLLSNIKDGQYSGVMAIAHVDVVADAHISAFESADASGRFLCYDRVLSHEEVVELLKFQSNLSIPSRLYEAFGQIELSNQKLLRLGVHV